MGRKPSTTSTARSAVRVLVVVLIGLWTAGTAILDFSVLWAPPRVDGINYNHQGVVLSVDPGSPAFAARIRPGDRITAPDSEFFVASPQVESMRIVHDGNTRFVTLRTVPGPALEVNDKITLFAGGIVFFVSLSVGSALVLMRPSRMTWAFYVFCASTVLVELGVYFRGSSALYWTLRTSLVYLHTVGDGAMLVFAARFPDDAPVGWRKWAERAGVAVCLFFPPLQIYTWPMHEIAGKFTPAALYIVNGVVYVAVYTAAIATFFTVYARSRGPERQRIQWALIFPIVLALRMPIILNRIVPFPFLNFPFGLALALDVASIAIPLGVAYAVIRHRVFDISFAISRTIVYGGLTSVMIAMFSLLHWFLAEQLAGTQLALTASIIVALSFGFGLNALHRNVDRLVERTLFRTRHNAERRLARAAAALPHADSSNAVNHFLINEPIAALDLASAAVFRRAADGPFVRTEASVGWEGCRVGSLFASDPLVLHLLAEHAPIRVAEVAWSPAGVPCGPAAPSLAVPVLIRRQLSEIILYGGHRNGADIDPSEERNLVPLAVGAGAAYDHLEAEALRMKVETLIREIDMKGREIEQLRTDLSAQRRQKRISKTTP